jgi:hypothetical protein
MRILTGVFTCDWGSLGGLRPSQREGPGLISGETRPLDRLRPCRSPLRARFGHRQRPQGPRSCPNRPKRWLSLPSEATQVPHNPPFAPSATRHRPQPRRRNRRNVTLSRLEPSRCHNETVPACHLRDGRDRRVLPGIRAPSTTAAGHPKIRARPRPDSRPHPQPMKPAPCAPRMSRASMRPGGNPSWLTRVVRVRSVHRSGAEVPAGTTQ